MTALDPDIAGIAEALKAQGAPRAFAGGVLLARERFEKIISAQRAGAVLPEVESVEDARAGEVPLRLYAPRGKSTGATIVFFHGGGYALGNLDLFDETARRLCSQTQTHVVAAGYRQPPEHPFPTPFDDAYAATLWTIEHAAELGGDRARVAVCGESAGGNLAACAAIRLRDNGVKIAAQLLIVPGVNLARELPADASYPLMDVQDLEDIRDNLLGKGADARRCPPSPLHAEDLGNVAPAVIAVAGHDPLEAEGLAYADRLRAAGVPVELLRLDDMHHTFFGFARASQGAAWAIARVCDAFRTKLETSSQIERASAGDAA